jgi:hypothetical protein
MKLEPPDLIKTSCKDCIFAIYEDKTQVECSADRIKIYKDKDRVIEAYDNDKEFYTIKEFCNYKRKATWNNGEPNLDKVYNEISSSFDIVIDCENLDEERKNYINKILERLNYNPEKTKITLYYPITQDRKYTKNTLELLCIYQPKYWTTVSSCLDKKEFVEDYLANKVRATYFLYINNTTKHNVDLSVLEHINLKINKELDKILVAENNEAFIVSSHLYKINRISKDITDIEQNINDIVSLAKEKNLFIKT